MRSRLLFPESYLSWPVLKQWALGIQTVLTNAKLRWDMARCCCRDLIASSAREPAFQQATDQQWFSWKAKFRTTIWPYGIHMYPSSWIKLFQLEHYHSLTEAFAWFPRWQCLCCLNERLGQAAFISIGLGLQHIGCSGWGAETGFLTEDWKADWPADELQAFSGMTWHSLKCDNIPSVLVFLVKAIVSSLLVKSDVWYPARASRAFWIQQLNTRSGHHRWTASASRWTAWEIKDAWRLSRVFWLLKNTLTCFCTGASTLP